MLKGRGAITAEELKSELKAFQNEVRKDVEAALAKQLEEIRGLRSVHSRTSSRTPSRTPGAHDEPSPLRPIQEAHDKADQEPLLQASDYSPADLEASGALRDETGEESPGAQSLALFDFGESKEDRRTRSTSSGAKNFVRDLVMGEGEEAEAAMREETEIVPKNVVQRILLPITTSDTWSFLSAVFVIIQCCTFCMNVDCHMKMLMNERFPGKGATAIPAICAYAETVIDVNLITFTFEVLFKVAAEQVHFFCGPNWSWNLFDGALWGIVLFDHFSLLPDSVGLLRIIRMIRLLRLFDRFHELRVMLYSIYACTTSLAWGFLLLGVFIVMTAVYLEDVACLYLMHDWGLDDTDKTALRDNWNGMFQASLSLIFGITGGADWGGLASPFFHMESPIPHFHGMVFTFFVVLTCIGMLNILVGVFCEQTQDLSDVSREVALTNAYLRVQQNADHMHELFDEFERADPMCITKEEITKGLQDKRIQTHFHHLGIDVLKPSLLVKLFDVNASGTVERKEFVKGCQRLQGGAKPAEMAEILTHVRAILQKLEWEDEGI